MLRQLYFRKRNLKHLRGQKDSWAQISGLCVVTTEIPPPRCSELIPLKTNHITTDHILSRNLLRRYSNEDTKACNKGCIKYDDNENRRPDLSCEEIDHI
jgi:hypothetical protein